MEDPSLEATALPIFFWAKQAQAGTLSKQVLDLIVKTAAAKLRGKRSWGAVRGPAGGLVMTLRRIDWKMISGTQVRDLAGRLIDLRSVDLRTLRRSVKDAEQARLWRALAKEQAAPWLAGGPFLKPLRDVHKQLFKQGKFVEAGGLVAAVSGTAWTQFERWHLGMSDDSRCQLCLAADGTMR